MKTEIIRLFICAAIIGVLPACQTVQKKPVSISIGMPVTQLIDAYGQPYSVSKDGQINHYVWHLSSMRLSNTGKRRSSTSISSDGAIASNSNLTSQVVRVFCQLDVTINANQLVQNWQATGGGCRQILLNQL